MKSVLRLLTLLCAFAAAPAVAQEPVTLTFNGDLSDLADAPISADLPMTFHIYDQAEGGVALWTEGNQVAVVDGRFSAVLGAIEALPVALASTPTLYLGVQIGDDAEQTPRMRLGGAIRTLWAAEAQDAVGEIHPVSVSIGETLVINADGQWVGEPFGAQGPVGPQGEPGIAGADGAQGPAGADGAQGPAGADGAQGPAGADGAQGPAGADGPQGPAGADGPQGAQGPVGADGAQGPMGMIGPQGPAGANGVQGPAGPDGPQGPVGSAGAEGPAGPQGLQGDDGAFEPLAPTTAVFGAGTILHHDNGDWVLEATASNTIQWRQINGGFYNIGFIAPAQCGGAAGQRTGSATMQSTFGFSFDAGNTASATLCTEGSVMLVQIYQAGGAASWFRCWRTHGNANACQRLF